MLYAAANVLISPVDNSNGILLLKQGQVLRQVDTFSLVCVYNISYLHVTSLKLLALYASTKAAEAHTASEDLHETYKSQIDHTLSLVHNKLIFLAPRSSNRAKRGLINGLGSVVKAITGNLDNEDAVKYEQQISELRNKVNSIHNQQGKSLILAENTINEFEKQMSKISENKRN